MVAPHLWSPRPRLALVACAAVTARDRQVAELRAQALELRTRGYAALDKGDGPLAQELLDRAILRTEVADLLEAGDVAAPLQKRSRSVTNRTMVSAARAHISAGKSREANAGEQDPLIAAANAKGHTMRSLGEAVGVPASIISRARKGSRRIKRSAAKAIEKLCGFPASEANWPGGWASE
jgi:hypothetical protein